jgi:branched-chain amino acid transport system permease protein
VNIAQVLNGLALGSLLMILSSGLALVYGLRGITNFAHGGLYMGGAYVAYSISKHGSFWLALIVAPLILAVVGAVLELLVFRRLTKRSHIEVGLLTFGIAMVIDRVVIAIWGKNTLPVSAPSSIDGTTSVFGTDYPTYRLFVIVVAVVMAAALTWWLRSTRTGLHIRASSHDVETASILGINTDRVSLVVVCLGSALAGLAGTIAAPYQSVSPGMGMLILVTVLIVVVLGGVGSIGGAMVAGMGLGIVQTVGAIWANGFSTLIPYVALVLVLLLKPTGLAGRRLT